METYNTNKKFKDYVDRYCKLYGLTVSEALQLSIVRAVEDQCKRNASLVADYRGQFMEKFTEVK